MWIDIISIQIVHIMIYTDTGVQSLTLFIFLDLDFIKVQTYLSLSL